MEKRDDMNKEKHRQMNFFKYVDVDRCDASFNYIVDFEK